MDIQLNFINQSNDMNNSEVVIFQKNVATNFNETPVAWKVIKNISKNDSHKFSYPSDYAIGIIDSYKNQSNFQAASTGQKWNVLRADSKDYLELDKEAASIPNEVQITNNLEKGSINANLYKDGNLLAATNALLPNQTVSFQLKPTLWIGVVNKVQEGELMDSAIISQVNTEFSLLGITKADIIMTGGGTGADATPFEFQLIPTS